MYKFLKKRNCMLGVLLAGIAALSSCIENDIPYPRIHADFLKFEVGGQLETTINTTTKIVSIKLADTVNMKQVRLLSYQITDSARISPEPGSMLDLTSPKKFMLSIYQDYEWTVQAEQTVSRSFVVEGQVGSSDINVENHVAVSYVPEGTDLSVIRIKTLQLGPSNAVTTPAISGVTDFTAPRKFTVKYHDVTEEWTVYVLEATNRLTFSRVDSWVSRAYLHGIGIEGADNGFEYRLANTESWAKVASSAITTDGGNFVAELKGLTPKTSYTARAYSDGEYSGEITFTTGEAVPLSNGSFDDWYKEGKVWNPWKSGESSFWDTGNKGATTLGESNSYPTDETATGSGQAAKLETKFVGLGSIGKLAAGNMFAGQYMKTDGTNGILNFGRPFTSFPTGMRIHYKYKSATIDYADDDHASLKGQQDRCNIYIALTDWSAPLEIRTNPKNRQLIDINDPNIIAYAAFETHQTASSYQEKVLTLDYRATDRVPTHILVVSSASKYGDFFTGGAGSILWVDNFELLYE